MNVRGMNEKTRGVTTKDGLLNRPIERMGVGVTRRKQSFEHVAVHKVRLRYEIKTLDDTRSVSKTMHLEWRKLARGTGGKPGGTR